MMTDSIGPASSLGGLPRQYSDDRAAMVEDKELTVDMYGSGWALRRSPFDESAANSLSDLGPQSTRTSNGASLTGSAGKKNGFLPSGMSRGSGRSNDSAKRQQNKKKMPPVWSRIAGKQGKAYINNQQNVSSATQPCNYLPPTEAGNGSTSESRNAADTSALYQLSGGEAIPSGAGDSRPQHLQVILGAPAGFRDTSFDESDGSKTSSDIRAARVSMNAAGTAIPTSEGFSGSKRPAPPVPPSPTPPSIVVMDATPRKRPAPEAPRSNRVVSSTSSDRGQSGSFDQSDSPAFTVTDIGKVVIPEVFRQSEHSGSPSPSPSSKPEVISNSILRRGSFMQRLEGVVGRKTPTVSALSSMARKNGGADDPSNTQLQPASTDLHQSTDSIVSRLFQSALYDHDDHGPKKFKFPVQGIDVPQEPEAGETEDVGLPRSPPTRKGFSYLKDNHQVAEVSRRAANMTARRPHESVEEALRGRTASADYDGTDADEATLRAARARLQAPSPRLDIPTSSVGDGRQQMLSEIVDIARKRARKMGLNSDDFDTTDSNHLSNTTHLNHYAIDENPVLSSLQPNDHETAVFHSANAGYEDFTLIGNKPEVEKTSRQDYGNYQAASGASDATHYYGASVAPEFGAGSTSRPAEGVASRSASLTADPNDIDRREGLAADYAGAHRVSSYTVLGPGLPTASHSLYGNARSHPHYSSNDHFRSGYDVTRAPLSYSSSDDDLGSAEWSDNAGADADVDAYRVSILGGQVRARRCNERRQPAARKQQPHQTASQPARSYERPVSVEIWSSDDENYPTDSHRQVKVIHRPSPLTVDISNYAASPHSYTGKVNNPHLMRIVPRQNFNRAKAGDEMTENLHYYSDPETNTGPNRTGRYIAPEMFPESPASLRSVGHPDIAGGPYNYMSIPVTKVTASVPSTVDPQLSDVGTKNRRYFVEMRLNTGRTRQEGYRVAGIGGDSGAARRLAASGWFGSAPQLLQLPDDATDQYSGVPPAISYATPRYSTLYDVTTDQRPTRLGARPQSTPPSTETARGVTASSTGHVLAPAAVNVTSAALDRRRPASVAVTGAGRVSRPTVEFDIELAPVNERMQQLDIIDGQKTSIHTGNSAVPHYTIQLNDTMRFDIDGVGPVTSPPTYQQSHPQRRHRPPELNGETRAEQRPTGDPQPPPRMSRRRRQIPVVYEEAPSDDVSVSVHELPRVVRGSILIRNSIDTSGVPRHIDVVTADGDVTAETPIVIEDNANMFDGLYRQSRENPLYLSDPEPDETNDVSRCSKPSRSQRPARNRGQSNRATPIGDDFNRSVHINREYGVPSKSSRSDLTPAGQSNSNGESRQANGGSSGARIGGSGIHGVRQRFDVQREEDEVIIRLPTEGSVDNERHAGAEGDASSMVNVDTVSEKIDVRLDGGIAQVIVRVRCERIVPIRGSEDLYRKSAVIVSRIIDIDLMETDERRRLYDRVMERMDLSHRSGEGRLNTEDTFALYQTLMGVADTDHPGSRERLHVEHLLDEQRSSAARLVASTTDEFLETSVSANPPRSRRVAQPPPRRIQRTTQTGRVPSADLEYGHVQSDAVVSNDSSDTATSLLY